MWCDNVLMWLWVAEATATSTGWIIAPRNREGEGRLYCEYESSAEPPLAVLWSLGPRHPYAC